MKNTKLLSILLITLFSNTIVIGQYWNRTNPGGGGWMMSVGALKPNDGTLLEIYRFKGKFSSSANIEVRTVLDGENKLAGFFVKKWKDKI